MDGNSVSTWVVNISFQLSEYLVCSVSRGTRGGDRQTMQPGDLGGPSSMRRPWPWRCAGGMSLSPPSPLVSITCPVPRGRAPVLGPPLQLSPPSPPSSRLPSFWLPQLALKVTEQTDKPFPWSPPRRVRLQLESSSESGPGLALACECEDRKNILVTIKSVKNVL